MQDGGLAFFSSQMACGKKLSHQKSCLVLSDASEPFSRERGGAIHGVICNNIGCMGRMLRSTCSSVSGGKGVPMISALLSIRCTDFWSVLLQFPNQEVMHLQRMLSMFPLVEVGEDEREKGGLSQPPQEGEALLGC